jgi:hypothetical protein
MNSISDFVTFEDRVLCDEWSRRKLPISAVHEAYIESRSDMIRRARTVNSSEAANESPNQKAWGEEPCVARHSSRCLPSSTVGLCPDGAHHSA